LRRLFGRLIAESTPVFRVSVVAAPGAPYSSAPAARLDAAS
jgi:hypothetical protein